MAESDDKTTVILDLDNAEFVSKLKESLGLLGEMGSGESLAGLVGVIGELGLILGPIAIAIAAVKTALDLAKESEHIQQVNNTFEMLAKNAGLAADVLKDRLVGAAGGLVGETELLQSANKAIVEMGGNASKLPEIMELARKYTAAFGGDVTTNFDNMSRALAFGNERMLRQYGITLDATKAHQEYAAQLGIGVEFLSSAGQKQSIFNAGLTRAHTLFDGIDTSTMKVTSSSQGLWAATKELWDAWAVGLNKALHLSDQFSHVIGRMTELVNIWTADVKSIFGIQEKSSEKNQENAKKEIALEGEKQKAMAKTGTGQDAVNLQKYKEAKLKFEQELLKIRKDRESAEEKVETDAAALHRLHEQEEISAAQKASQAISNLTINGLQKGLLSQEQYAAGVKNIQQKLEADLKNIRTKFYTDDVTALKNLEKQNQFTAAGFSTAWHKNAAQANQDLHNFAKLGDTAFNGVKTHAVAAFKAMGNGSKDAGDAIKGFLFGTIGDVAVAQGTEILMTSIWPPNPIGLAAGGALIAFGEALSSFGQGSGGVPSGGANSGGAGGGASVTAADTTGAAQAPQPQAAQQKSLSIAFHGDFLDTDATRTRFMDIIRQSGDYTDFNLLKVGQSGS